jgi:multicomponent Na+:H+ antiporter subunit B
MTGRYESVVVDVTTRIMVPLLQVFAIYVILHGHYSPGGGFQGGVILAASIILLRLTLGNEKSYKQFPVQMGVVLACIGVLIFAVIGLLPMFLGAEFLDYGQLPLPGVSEVMRRYYGILVVEAAIGLAVWGALVAIYDKLTGATEA